MREDELEEPRLPSIHIVELQREPSFAPRRLPPNADAFGQTLLDSVQGRVGGDSGEEGNVGKKLRTTAGASEVVDQPAELCNA